jgi:hypothetical protein
MLNDSRGISLRAPLSPCSDVRQNGGGKQQGGACRQRGAVANVIGQQATGGLTHCDGGLDDRRHQAATGFGFIG